MKAKYDSNLEYGKKLAKFLMVAVVVLGAFTVFAGANPMLQQILLILTVACMIGTVVSVYKYCRCPYCGKHILMGVLRAKVCPSCTRNLTTGKKAKKNER